MSASTAHRGALLHFLDDLAQSQVGAFEYWKDGILWLEDGRVKAAGPAARLLKRLPRGLKVVRHPDALIVPGFVDCHVHFSQTEVIAAYGEQLLAWLSRHAFPVEARFKDPAHAREVARVFLKEMLRNGTTTALVFPTVHAASVEAIFEEALRLGLRLVSGKVLMDRNAPPALLESPEAARRASRRLIREWHGRGRLLYAVTPRFAPTCSPALLETAGRLLAEHPGVYLHTHLAECRREVEWVRRLFPGSRDYLAVYERRGLVGPRSVFAHCVKLSDGEWRRLASAGASAAFCPTSNLFLGSGLFDLGRARRHGAPVGLGTDVGAGTSFSLLQNLNEAYKILQLQGQRLSPLDAFRMATLGGARALGLDGMVGNFAPGKEADFVVLDLKATPLLAYRSAAARSIEDALFLLMTLGDDRAVRSTWVMGRRLHAR